MSAGFKQPGSRAQQMQNLRALLTEIPKTEIHLHLEGLVTVDTIWDLMKKRSITYDQVSSKDDLQKRFQITSFDEFLDLFINVIQSSFKSEEDIEYLIDDALAYLERNNIVYAEIFFAPSKFLLNGFQFSSMIDRLNTGANMLKEKHGREIKFIIDVSRTFGVKNAENNLQLTLDNPSENIIGIGLGGVEATGPAKDYKKVFAKARDNGFHVVAHAGEDVGPESIWDAIKHLKAERIGHGISAIQDDKLVKHLANKQIPLEVCPTSNLFTQKYVKVLEEHPIRDFYDRGVYVTLNTDDPTLFGIDLIDEYMNLTNKGFFTPAEIITLVKNNLYATFLPKKRKDAIWKSVDAVLSNYQSTLSLT